MRCRADALTMEGRLLPHLEKMLGADRGAQSMGPRGASREPDEEDQRGHSIWRK
jgi:hypothetical protein